MSTFAFELQKKCHDYFALIALYHSVTSKRGQALSHSDDSMMKNDIILASALICSK